MENIYYFRIEFNLNQNLSKILNKITFELKMTANKRFECIKCMHEMLSVCTYRGQTTARITSIRTIHSAIHTGVVPFWWGARNASYETSADDIQE